MTVAPTIHLNGTCGQDLRREYTAAYEAVKDAIDKLHKTTCHGRDYYPQEMGAYSQAKAERDIALSHLREAENYVAEMLMGIKDQLKR